MNLKANEGSSQTSPGDIGMSSVTFLALNLQTSKKFVAALLLVRGCIFQIDVTTSSEESSRVRLDSVAQFFSNPYEGEFFFCL